MLTNEEHQAMIMFDRLLMAARENETIADLLDQTLNVARMIDPRPDDKVVYGPLQRMHFEWQQMSYRMNELSKKMDNYINQQNRWGHVSMDTNSISTGGIGSTYPQSTWPSNPGWATGSKGDFTSSNFPTMTALSMGDIEKVKSQLSKLSIEVTNKKEEILPTPKTNK